MTDVVGVRLWSAEGDGTFLDLAFLPAAAPVESAHDGPPGGYHGDTEGQNWQDAWLAHRGQRAFVVVGGGDAVLAEQPW
ncbi:hypothetical protein ACI784_18635 [Geodermatophilus sp. SYSU D01186]